MSLSKHSNEVQLVEPIIANVTNTRQTYCPGFNVIEWTLYPKEGVNFTRVIKKQQKKFFSEVKVHTVVCEHKANECRTDTEMEYFLQNCFAQGILNVNQWCELFNRMKGSKLSRKKNNLCPGFKLKSSNLLYPPHLDRLVPGVHYDIKTKEAEREPCNHKPCDYASKCKFAIIKAYANQFLPPEFDCIHGLDPLFYWKEHGWASTINKWRVAEFKKHKTSPVDKDFWLNPDEWPRKDDEDFSDLLLWHPRNLVTSPVNSQEVDDDHDDNELLIAVEKTLKDHHFIDDDEMIAIAEKTEQEYNASSHTDKSETSFSMTPPRIVDAPPPSPSDMSTIDIQTMHDIIENHDMLADDETSIYADQAMDLIESDEISVSNALFPIYTSTPKKVYEGKQSSSGGKNIRLWSTYPLPLRVSTQKCTDTNKVFICLEREYATGRVGKVKFPAMMAGCTIEEIVKAFNESKLSKEYLTSKLEMILEELKDTT